MIDVERIAKEVRAERYKIVDEPCSSWDDLDSRAREPWITSVKVVLGKIRPDLQFTADELLRVNRSWANSLTPEQRDLFHMRMGHIADYCNSKFCLVTDRVEETAKKLYGAGGWSGAWETVSSQWRETYRKMARAVLEDL